MTGDAAPYFHEAVRPFALAGERGATVLLLHGWTGSPAHFRPMGEYLHRHGFGVAAPLLPGHGTHVEAMMATGWRDWLRGAGEAAQDVIESGERLHIAGLSMGGVLGILLAPGFGAASLTTINAPQRLVPRLARFARFVRGSRLLRADEPVPFADDVAGYAHHYEESPLGTLADLLDLVRASRRMLPRVHCPALVVQSLVDETVRPESAEIIFRELGSTRKEILWLERSRHLALLDAERDLMHRRMLAFLENAERAQE